MATRNIFPLDEVIALCTEDFPGEDFSDFSDETEELSDHNESESEDNVCEDESVSSSNFEDSDAESDSNGMCFACLFVLATEFTTYFRHRLAFYAFLLHRHQYFALVELSSSIFIADQGTARDHRAGGNRGHGRAARGRAGRGIGSAARGRAAGVGRPRDPEL